MTKQTIVRLERDIEFGRIPCVGEWITFESSGLMPAQVTEVTHDEQGNTEVVMGARHDDPGQVLFHETDEDLQADVTDLVSGGWQLMSTAPNKVWGDV